MFFKFVRPYYGRSHPYSIESARGLEIWRIRRGAIERERCG
jgi:hypothetical protein